MSTYAVALPTLQSTPGSGIIRVPLQHLPPRVDVLPYFGTILFVYLLGVLLLGGFVRLVDRLSWTTIWTAILGVIVVTSGLPIGLGAPLGDLVGPVLFVDVPLVVVGLGAFAVERGHVSASLATLSGVAIVAALLPVLASQLFATWVIPGSLGAVLVALGYFLSGTLCFVYGFVVGRARRTAVLGALGMSAVFLSPHVLHVFVFGQGVPLRGFAIGSMFLAGAAPLLLGTPLALIGSTIGASAGDG